MFPLSLVGENAQLSLMFTNARVEVQFTWPMGGSWSDSTGTCAKTPRAKEIKYPAREISQQYLIVLDVYGEALFSLWGLLLRFDAVLWLDSIGIRWQLLFLRLLGTRWHFPSWRRYIQPITAALVTHPSPPTHPLCRHWHPNFFHLLMAALLENIKSLLWKTWGQIDKKKKKNCSRWAHLQLHPQFAYSRRILR